MPPLSRLAALVQWLRARKASWRKPLLGAALLAFGMGCWLSWRHMQIAPGDLHLAPLVLIVLLIVPVSIVYSALNMMLLGQAARVPMGFAASIKVSVLAQVAELLPIPGGAIVRTTALVKAGSSTRVGAELVIACSLLWIACGAAGAGLALAHVGWPAWLLAAGGTAGALVLTLWIGLRFGSRIALTAAALRLLGVALVAWRLSLSFAAIGVAIGWFDATAFAFATILGSAASLVPAGLGVSEGLSALLAQPGGVAPAAAFLAAALSRSLGLVVNFAMALAYAVSDRGAQAPVGARG